MLLLSLLPLLLACTDSSAPIVPSEERPPGERTPVTRTCEGQDTARCMLPFPSSAFMAEDPDSLTGLTVAIDPDAFPVDDDPRALNWSDGFSRLSAVTTMVDGTLTETGLAPYPAWTTDAELRVFNAQPDHPEFGQGVPLFTDVFVGGWEQEPESLLIGYPRVPLAANAEHVVVLTDGIAVEDGRSMDQPWEVRVVLGLEEPATQEEADLQAYHAPTRTLLSDQGVDFERVLRVWDFTTRSTDDPTRRLASMVDQVAAAADALGVEVDGFVSSSNDDIAGVVLGRITGVPEFRDDDGFLVLDDDGLPVIQGETEARFRVLLPAGKGDYRVTLYGHGTGGDVSDDSFDASFASFDVAKVGTRFLGWTGDELVLLFASLSSFQQGIERSSTGLMQAVANTQAILQAIDDGPLADLLSAETIDGEANPAAGRRPDASEPMWTGGSLGGAMGSVISASFPQIHYSVCNVPNGAWSHTIPGSLIYDTAMAGVLGNIYGDEIDVVHQLIISQTTWDDIDGSAWADPALEKGTMFLLQQSMEDPVVPNAGTDNLAVALGATMVGPVLLDVPGLPKADQVSDGAGITQYRVPNTGVYDVHGFAARDTPAGDAAFEQISEFMNSVWLDEDPLITFPDLCADVTTAGDCDFSDMWEE